MDILGPGRNRVVDDVRDSSFEGIADGPHRLHEDGGKRRQNFFERVRHWLKTRTGLTWQGYRNILQVRHERLLSVGFAKETTEFTLKFEAICQLTFPNRDLVPTNRFQLRRNFRITLDIPRKLFAPEIKIAFGRVSKATAVVSMPEATMDIDGSLVFWQNEVGFAGHVFCIEPKSIAQTVQ
jgi:hypothetical protein